MQVLINNIQGFRGVFTYSLSESLTIINSKYNGVGKTTLYDCIRFLVDPDGVDKEEHQFFLNINEGMGTFQITNADGITHGFQIKRGFKPRFFCKIGDNIEASTEPFPTAASDIGILIINDTLFNIFDKQINLFSSSKHKGNYELIREVTTHKPTEEMLTLITNSIELNKRELKETKTKSQEIHSRLSRQKYFTALDELKELIDNDSYEESEIVLTYLDKELSGLKPIGRLETNSEAIYVLDELAVAFHDNLIPNDLPVLNSDMVIMFEDLDAVLEMLEPVGLGMVLNVDLIDSLDELVNLTSSLEPVNTSLRMNEDLVSMMDELVSDTQQLTTIGQLSIQTDILRYLESVAQDATLTRIEFEKGKRAAEEAGKLKKILSDVRIPCPIRREVYLVNGECQY